MIEYICKDEPVYDLDCNITDYDLSIITELIRCKDCKYCYYHEMLKQYYCVKPNMQFGEIEPNGYCHRAERKEE